MVEEPTLKVFGGQDTTRGEFPYQVSLRRVDQENTHFCGASIIHPLLLLTAAHCITHWDLKPSQIRAVAGEHSLAVDGEVGEQIRNVSNIIVHHGWNSSTYENDIAILVLGKPLETNKYTGPVDTAKGDEIRAGHQRLNNNFP